MNFGIERCCENILKPWIITSELRRVQLLETELHWISYNDNNSNNKLQLKIRNKENLNMNHKTPTTNTNREIFRNTSIDNSLTYQRLDSPNIRYKRQIPNAHCVSIIFTFTVLLFSKTWLAFYFQIFRTETLYSNRITNLR